MAKDLLQSTIPSNIFAYLRAIAYTYTLVVIKAMVCGIKEPVVEFITNDMRCGRYTETSSVRGRQYCRMIQSTGSFKRGIAGVLQ